jgi:hypothetical protein
MFDFLPPSIGKVNIRPNGVFNHAVLNKKGHVYGFKFSCHTDTQIISNDIKKVFEESGLSELSVFIVKSQTSFKPSSQSDVLIKCNDNTSFSGAVIEKVNDHLHSKSFASTYYFESLYICSDSVLEESFFSSIVKILSNKGLILTGLNQDELISQLGTWTGDLKSKFSFSKGHFGEVSFKYRKNKVRLTAPLIELKGPPTTALHNDLDTSNCGYKLMTCCYFLKVEDKTYTRYFYGIRLFINLQKIGDPYKDVNVLLSKLAALKIKFIVSKDSINQYISMIPGMFHTSNFFVKTAVKNLDRTLPSKITISQNNFQEFHNANKDNYFSGYTYPIETNNHEYGYLDLLNKNTIICGNRDEYYKSLIAQEIAFSIDSGKTVVIIDPSSDMAYFPFIFKGDSVTNIELFKEELYSYLYSSDSNEGIVSEFENKFGSSIFEYCDIDNTKISNRDIKYAKANKSSYIHFQPRSIKEYFLYMVVCMELSKRSPLKVFLNEAENVDSSNFTKVFIDTLNKNKSYCLFGLGSGRLFDDKQIAALDLFDTVISRSEIHVKSKFKSYEVLDLNDVTTENSAWFGVVDENGNRICKIPAIQDLASLYNSSYQNEHMVRRMSEGGATPRKIFEKLSALK